MNARTAPLSIAEAFETYLVNETDKRKSQRSQIGERLLFWELRQYLDKVLGIKDDRPVTEVLRFHLDQYQTHLVVNGSAAGEQLKPSTINRRFHSIKNLFRRLEDWGFVAESPARKTRSLPERFAPRDRWQEFELQVVLRSGELSRRDKDFMRFLLATGARLGSAVSLLQGDVDQGSRTIRFRQRKGTGDELSYRAPLSLSALELIAPRLTGCMDMHVFTDAAGRPLSAGAVSKRFSRFFASINRPHLTLHGLRHTFASNLHAAGASTETIRLLLGHTSGRMTEKYLHTEMDHLRIWVDK